VRATTSAWFSGGFLWRRSAIWWFGVLSAWWIGWKSLLSAWWLSPLSSTSRLYLLSSAFRTSAWWIGFLSSNICNRWFRQWSSALCASTSRVCLLSSAFRTSTSRICLRVVLSVQVHGGLDFRVVKSVTGGGSVLFVIQGTGFLGFLVFV